MGEDHAAHEANSLEVVTRLKAAGVNLLALDFDMTVLDIHTGGRWGGQVGGWVGCVTCVLYVLIIHPPLSLSTW